MSFGLEGDSFGQRRPPLSHLIKTILREYPQGQVFKEIIQNADDAGATVVKFYLDCRNLSTLPHELVADRRVHQELNRFQGPALMAYNNAPFQEKDWEGIQNLQQSGKAKNPLKVGKFGVGFNSVYHITDLPVIISGKHCGYFEPQEEIWKGEPGKRFNLTTLQSRCQEALQPYYEVEGFSPPSFHGKTLFRLPLRKKESELSKATCSIESIRVLLKVLKAEAKYLLLFLQSVCSIEILEILLTSECKSLFKVSVTTHYLNEHQKQLQMLAREVREQFNEITLYNTKSIISRKMHFKIDTHDAGDKTTMHEWLVVHRVGSEDEEVLELAKQQHVLPWVGTAYEISRCTSDSGGRIYCFLPLPTEDRAPFSINVNGTFAVSSNRRSLNWESQERQGDNEGKWNKILVGRCLPHCYYELILELVKIPSISPDIVYKCWPDISHVQGTPWEGILKPLYNVMLHSPYVVHSCVNKGQWISLEQAVLIPQGKPLPDILKSVLLSIGTKLVDLPSVKRNVITKYYSNKLLNVSPSLVRNVLRGNRSLYSKLSPEKKLEVLQYCLSDENFADLAGLELIPLANNLYETFKLSSESSLYVCSSNIRHTLLPGLEQFMIDVLDLNKTCHSLLLNVAENNVTQLTVLTPLNVAKLISQYNDSYNWSQSHLQRFWEWLQNYSLNIFCDLSIVPVKNSNGDVTIHELSKQSSVVYVSNSLVNVSLRKGLEKCGVHFASVLEFEYLHHQSLSKCLKSFQPENVLDSISEPNVIKKQMFNDKESFELQKFFNNFEYNVKSNDIRVEKLCAMSIFTVLQDTKKFYSLNDVRVHSDKAFAQGEKYTIKTQLIPNHPLIFQEGQPLLFKLPANHVCVLQEIDYLEIIAFQVISKQAFPEENLTEFMINVLDNLRSYKYQRARNSLLKTLQSLPFVTVDDTSIHSCVRKPPSSLLDPNSKILLKLFDGEALFPSKEFKNHIQELRMCGLMDVESVTATMLYQIISQLPTAKSLIERMDATTYAKIEALFTFLNKFPSKLNEFVPLFVGSLLQLPLRDAICQKAMCNIFPVVTTKPCDYPSCLKWKGSSYNMFLSRFVRSEVIILEKSVDHSKSDPDPRIIGSQVFFVQNIPLPICQALSSTSETQRLFVSVVKHFKHVIENRTTMDLVTLEEISFLTYKYLSSTTCMIDDLHYDDEWVWIENCSTFVKPRMCALNSSKTFKSNLEPFIYVLSKKMKKNYEQLLLNHGVHNTVTNDMIIEALKSIKSKSIEISPLEAWTLVKSILNWIISIDYTSDDLLVPICCELEYPELYPVNQVSYTDNKILLEIAESSDEDYTLVHPSINAHLASQLGLMPLNDQLGITEDVFEDAGQYEPLTTRLSNILKEYKDGLTIIKEMIQNADDAEATEVNILYDAREHTKENLSFKGMADSHGPALVIHNNAKFTDDDFANITKLAGATKKDKPLKIGKFGVGFCSVYHITDVPSFVSGEWLYIFDPTLSYLKGVVKNKSRPGTKIKYMSKFISKTNQLAPYKNLFKFNPLAEYNGTMFRFPFRSHVSEISSKIYDKCMVDQLKAELEEKGKEMLLFLSHVKRIRFFSIEMGKEIPVEEIIVENMCCQDCDNIFTTITTNNSDNILREEYWLSISIESQEQFNNKETKEQSNIIIVQPAVSTVACHLLKTSNNQYEVVPVDGLVFCYLPLSVPPTGLPVHVSANFAVMSNRRGIWTSASLAGIPSNSREQWNQQLMTSVVPIAYCNLLNMLKDMQLEGKLINYNFHMLLPLLGKLTTQYPWEKMIKTLFEKLLDEELIYSRFSDRWMDLKQCSFLSDSILSFKGRILDCIIDSLCILKFSVVDIPQEYVEELIMVNMDLQIFDQSHFCSNFLLPVNIAKFKDHYEIRNKVLFQMFVTAESEIAANEESDLKKLLEVNPSIPSTPNGVDLKLASKLVDRQSNLKILFDETSEMLPIDSFSERQPVRKLMIDIGLLTTQLPWDLVLKCARSISAIFELNKKKALKQVQTLIKVVNENIENGDCQSPLISELKIMKFIPVVGKPNDEILPWKGDDMIFAAPYEMFHPTILKYGQSITIKKDCCLLGSQKVIINNLPLSTDNGCGIIPDNVLKVLDIESELSFDDVLANYECLISACKSKVNGTCVERKFINNIESTCRMTYEFFHTQLKRTSNRSIESKLSSFSSKPFIWSGTHFVRPQNVAMKWKEKGPVLYEVPQLISERKKLIKILGIREKFSIKKLLDTLKDLHDEYAAQVLPSQYHCMIDAIINEFNTHKVEDFKHHIVESDEMVVLPSLGYELYLSNSLSYNDSPWLQDIDEGKYTLVHKTLNREIALAMGVQLVLSKFLERYVTSSGMKFGGSPFGQKENLTQRIKNIIEEYPFDATLLKELLQNADDAKATKMCVILDKRKNYGQEQLLSKEWAELQGPALIVWNNQEFSEKDIEGIQNLGLGSKRNNSGTIGQFGIGFNVVYHLTDCPSFISGGKTLCIFDPHCKYIPGIDYRNPGGRYDNLDATFWNEMSDMKDTYLQGDVMINQPRDLDGGTLFRFPLRHTIQHIMESKLVNDQSNPLTAEKLEAHLNEWVPQIKDALIFLNHITEFSYYVIEKHFICKAQYTVNMNKETIENRESFFKSLKQFRKDTTPDVFTYEIQIKCFEKLHVHLKHQQYSEDWLVQQGIGELGNTTQKWQFIEQVLPKHGIAAPIKPCSSFCGKLFCFLPLPTDSCLPVHINGQFILNSNRQTLWVGQDEKQTWNDSLLHAIASSYVHFLNKAREVIVGSQKYEDRNNFYEHVNSYYRLFPFWMKTQQQSSLPDNNCNQLAQFVFKKLWATNAEILAVEVFNEREGTNPKSLMRVEWNCLRNTENPFEQAFFLPPFQDADEKKEKVLLLLKIVNIKSTCAPYTLYIHLKSLSHQCSLAIPNSVFEFYCTFYEKIVPHCPCPIEETPFKKLETFKNFINCFLVRAQHETDGTRFELIFLNDSPFNLPLLLTADGFLRFFKKNLKVMRTYYCDLFPNSASMFLHREFLSMSLCSSYFVSTNNIPYSKIHELMDANYFKDLQKKLCNNFNGNAIKIERLRYLWKSLLCHKDKILFQHIQHILKSWSLIPAKNGWLYSTRNEILPITDLNIGEYQDIFEIFVTVGCLPVLDISHFPNKEETVPYDIKQFIPTITDYDQVLSMLYHSHCNQSVLDNLAPDDSCVGKLLQYFSNTTFLKNTKVKEQMMFLPLFKTIDGCLTNLTNKQVFHLPRDQFCLAGYDKWAPKGSCMIFLEHFGDWEKLTTDFSNIGKDLSEKEVYLELIFPKFSELSPKERQQHLEYIRDILYPEVQRAYALSPPVANSRERQAENYFLKTLKNLKCMHDCLQTDQLRRIAEFSDHTVDIYKYFPKGYIFLPTNYQNKEWLTFFRDLGLKVKITPEEFIGFCKEVENGQSHANNLKSSSEVLFKYLYIKGLDWDPYYVKQIASICFVLVSDLPKLSWIKAPCQPPNCIITDGRVTANFTSLEKAVTITNAELIWTAKPVIELPPTASVDYWISNFQSLVAIKPSPNDVLQNLINISTCGLSNSDLFLRYKPEYTVREKDKNRTHVIEIFEKSVSFLQKENCLDMLLQLKGYACIPVSAELNGLEDIPSKIVLVKSISVVAQLASQTDESLMPYINEVPNCLKPLMRSLELIGVTKNIQLLHIQHLLKTLHDQIGRGGTINPNQLRALRFGIIKLHELLSKNQHSEENILEDLMPLYLSTKNGNQWFLHQCNELLFADGKRYSDRDIRYFKFENTSVHLFQIPPDTQTAVQLTDNALTSINEASLCCLLPESIRPYPLFLCTTEKKMLEAGFKSSEENLLKIFLLRVLNLLNPIKEVFLEIVKHRMNCHTLGETSPERIASSFMCVLKHLEIEVIEELQAEVFIDTIEIGTLSNPSFILEKKDNSHYTLYLSHSVGTDDYIWRELSTHILMEIAVILNKPSKDDLFYLIEVVMKCLQVHSESILVRLAEEYEVQYLDRPISEGQISHDDESNVDETIPKVGKKIPKEFQAMLDMSIDNIYKPQEWVGYEIKEDPSIIIWAVIIHPIAGTEKNHMKQYKVLTSEDNREGITVSAIDLFKLMPRNMVTKISTSKEIAIYSKDSDDTEIREEWNDANELKKAVCEDLKNAWEITDTRMRQKALKRLYLKYHPDKAKPENRKNYEEAFKFLKRQIDRLENGLPLEDPDEDEEDEDEEPSSQPSAASSRWSDFFGRWRDEVPRWSNFSYSGQHHDYEERSGSTGGTSGGSFFTNFQTQASPNEANRWCRQAEADCEAMKVIKCSMNLTGSHFCQVILLAHETIEKSLKAGMYALFGLNSGGLMTHNLQSFAASICSEKPAANSLRRINSQEGDVSLIHIAKTISPYYTKVRYPNEHPEFKAPVDVYTRRHAEEAAEFAEIVIKFIRNIC